MPLLTNCRAALSKYWQRPLKNPCWSTSSAHVSWCWSAVFERMCVDRNPLTWSSRNWTMISCLEAAASIRGVKPDPGSLWMKEKVMKTSVWMKCRSSFGMNEDTHLTLASALLSSRNLTICWWPVLVQWNRAVQPRESFSSNSAPCFRGKKNKKPFMHWVTKW